MCRSMCRGNLFWYIQFWVGEDLYLGRLMCPIPVFRLPAPSCADDTWRTHWGDAHTKARDTRHNSETHGGHTGTTHTQKRGTHFWNTWHTMLRWKIENTQNLNNNKLTTLKELRTQILKHMTRFSMTIVAMTKAWNVHERRHLWSQNFLNRQGLTRNHMQCLQILQALFDQHAVRQNM